ncbi:hypothetical protein Tco_0549249 [Tanacetum coccineum]
MSACDGDRGILGKNTFLPACCPTATHLDKMVPHIAASLIVAKLGAGGHNYLFDWLSRQLVGLADFLDGIPLLRSVYVAMMVMKKGWESISSASASASGIIGLNSIFVTFVDSIMLAESYLSGAGRGAAGRGIITGIGAGRGTAGTRPMLLQDYAQ